MFGRFLDHLEEWLIAFLMGAATLLIFVAVVHRYAAGWHYPAFLQFIQDFLLKINLSWAQELCIYMFIWMAKFGAAYGVRHGTHVGVDVLVRALSPAKARWLTIIGLSGGALFTVGHRHDGRGAGLGRRHALRAGARAGPPRGRPVRGRHDARPRAAGVDRVPGASRSRRT